MPSSSRGSVPGRNIWRATLSPRYSVFTFSPGRRGNGGVPVSAAIPLGVDPDGLGEVRVLGIDVIALGSDRPYGVPLDRLLGGGGKIFFANSGAEANENALHLARRYTGRQTIVSVNGGWHGRTAATLACTDGAKYEAALRRDLLAHLLLWPVASLVYLYNAVVAAFSRRITWRGITYNLLSPTEAVIISRD